VLSDTRFKTITPATISPMPSQAAQSSLWPKTVQPITVTMATPSPDQIA
jgi:hypothetical protein